MTLTTEERIIRARVQIQKRNSFFAYLSLFLKFHEAKKGDMPQDTMGVDLKGNVHYIKEWIDKLTDEELQGVIVHEIGHIVFLSELRQGGRNRDGWNCATDLAINTLLKNNNFTLPKPNICSDYNDEFKIPKGKTIKKCSEKTAEQIYDLFPKIQQQKSVYYIISKNGKKGDKIGDGFDVHIKDSEGKDGKGKNKGGLSQSERAELEKDWLGKIQEALIVSKTKGDIPRGIERLCEHLHKEQIDWKTILQRFITNQIAYNHSYSFPHKKSISVGTYLPHELKEEVDICVLIDLSGSIGKQEYISFISEVVGLAKAYRERIKIHFFSHDTECYDGGIIENGNLKKIMNLKLKGGGGTSHKSSFEYIKENVRDCKAVLFFSDGYSDLQDIDFEKYPFEKLFIITKDGDEECLKGKRCKVIKLKENY